MVILQLSGVDRMQNISYLVTPVTDSIDWITKLISKLETFTYI